jgi:hypothetical protein
MPLNNGGKRSCKAVVVEKLKKADATEAPVAEADTTTDAAE